MFKFYRFCCNVSQIHKRTLNKKSSSLEFTVP